MKVFHFSFIWLAAALLLTGCNIYETTRAKHEEATEFLPDSGKLQKQSAKFPFQLFYMKEDARHFKYTCFAPVNTSYLRKSENWAKFDQRLAGKLGQDVQQLADYMHERLVCEYNLIDRPTKPVLVDSPQKKDCAIIETAIVAIIPNKAELNALGLAANLIAPGISVIVARAAAGSISIECKVRDSDTGEIIAMYSATFKDQAAILNLKALSWYGSAKRSIERVAKDTVTIFATRDYSSIKRDFPVKLISL